MDQASERSLHEQCAARWREIFQPHVTSLPQTLIDVLCQQEDPLRPGYWRSPQELHSDLALIRLTQVKWALDYRQPLAPPVQEVVRALGGRLEMAYTWWEDEQWGNHKRQELDRMLRSPKGRGTVGWPPLWPSHWPPQDQVMIDIVHATVTKVRNSIGAGRFRVGSTLTTFAIGALCNEARYQLRCLRAAKRNADPV